MWHGSLSSKVKKSSEEASEIASSAVLVSGKSSVSVVDSEKPALQKQLAIVVALTDSHNKYAITNALRSKILQDMSVAEVSGLMHSASRASIKHF